MGIERRINRNLLRVSKFKLELRHPPLDQSNRIAGEQIEQLARIVEDRYFEVAHGIDITGEARHLVHIRLTGARPLGSHRQSPGKIGGREFIQNAHLAPLPIRITVQHERAERDDDRTRSGRQIIDDIDHLNHGLDEIDG